MVTILAALFGRTGGGAWGGRGSTPPRVVIFGSKPDCTAVVHADDPEHENIPGMWVITDTRLRYIAFPPTLDETDRSEAVARTGYDHLPIEPASHVVHLEVTAPHLTRQEGIVRSFPRRFKTREAIYNRYRFPDGSGVDLRADTITTR